jgi:hypothetical protein
LADGFAGARVVAGRKRTGIEQPTAESPALVSGFGLGGPEEQEQRDCGAPGQSDENPAPIHRRNLPAEGAEFNNQRGKSKLQTPTINVQGSISNQASFNEIEPYKYETNQSTK